MDPDWVQRRGILLRVYYWTKQYDKAIAEAESLLKLKPDLYVAFQHLGLAYSQLDLHERAIETLEKARGNQ